MDNANVIVSDLDGTLTVDDKAVPYPEKPAAADVVEAAKAAKAAGFKLVVATARNMRTYKGDVDLIRTHTLPVVEGWLARTGVEHDGVVVGKTWCGPRGFYVDDRNLHPEEFVFRFTGPLARRRVDVVTLAPDVTPETLGRLHEVNRRLERWLHVASYRYLVGPAAGDELPPTLRDDAFAAALRLPEWPGDGAAAKAWLGTTGDSVLLADGRVDGYDPAAFFGCYAADLTERPPAGGLVAVDPLPPGTHPAASGMVLIDAAKFHAWAAKLPDDHRFLPSLAATAGVLGARRLPALPSVTPRLSAKEAAALAADAVRHCVDAGLIPPVDVHESRAA